MKYIAIITLGAVALSLGACASKNEGRSDYGSSSSTMSTSTGYSK